MKYIILSVRDAKADAFGRPIFVGTVATGARSFSDEVNRKDADNQMFNHPEDFSLYDLGSFDDQTGSFELHSSPQFVLEAVTVKS